MEQFGGLEQEIRVLPFRTTRAAAEPPPAWQRDPATDSRRSPHILIMDDTPAILDVLRELLEDEGWRVTTSLTLLDVADVKGLTPDLILLDLFFQASSQAAWDFLARSARDPDLRQVPRILCTAAAPAQLPEMARDLERFGVPVITKPFDADVLLARIREGLATRSPQVPRLPVRPAPDAELV